MSDSWKQVLQDQMSDEWSHEIDLFEAQVELRKQGKVDEKVFAETRLRRGAYGQRYDNGQRHDGVTTRELPFPSDGLTKGPETVWDAPGMIRIKVPYGGLTVEQLEVMADLAEEYSDRILHVTTRQDIQLHYIHIEDVSDTMRRLAAVGITTREACGNSVRNVTACPISGVCCDEVFDVTPYAKELMLFLLGHPDVQDFGRKVKPAFSGCADKACGLVNMHDLGYVAKIQEVDGVERRGFAVYVGGGLGAVPHQAKVLYEFVTEEEIFPVTQAVCRVYARLGEKRNRNRARLKFLISKVGIDDFRQMVEEERAILPHDDRWTSYLPNIEAYDESPLKEVVQLEVGASHPDGYAQWVETNVYRQRQKGYVTVTLNMPLGDFTSWQARQLADIAGEYVGDGVRLTVEQNAVLRWVRESDLVEVYRRLAAIDLAEPGAGTIVDITSCPGTDTCKLGIAASRGLAGQLREELTAKIAQLPASVRDLKIKVSGCFNSCSQHHLADIGFYGNSRKIGNYAVPHFQVVLGGQWRNNGDRYGMMMGAVPSKAIPSVVEMLATRFADERQEGELFGDWIDRSGKKTVRQWLKEFSAVPDHATDPNFYSDWGDPREFTIGDMGVGECAGEVVTLFSMEMSRAESEVFDAQIEIEEGNHVAGDAKAYQGMVMAAQALVKTQFLDVGDDPDRIITEFRERFFDTKLFFDKYATGKFAQYLFARHDSPNPSPTAESVRNLIDEANLFIEATYACETRMTASAAAS